MAQMYEVGKHATTIATGEDGKTRVTYHSTIVVEFDNEIVTLNTGGWETVTTKTRMNQTSNKFRLGYQVYQKNYQWYIWFPGTDREEIPFEGRKVSFQRKV